MVRPTLDIVPEPWIVVALVSAGPVVRPVMAPLVRVRVPVPLKVVAALISSVPLTVIAPVLISVAAEARVREAPVATVTVPEFVNAPREALSVVSLLAPIVTVAPVLLVNLPETVMLLGAPCWLVLLVEIVPLFVRPPVTVSLPTFPLRLCCQSW